MQVAPSSMQGQGFRVKWRWNSLRIQPALDFTRVPLLVYRIERLEAELLGREVCGFHAVVVVIVVITAARAVFSVTSS